MDTNELTEIAAELIRKHPGADSGSINDRLYLTIPEPNRHNGCRVRVFAGKGPYSVIINGIDGQLTVYASARGVLRYLENRL